jgi:hypothetical protein
MECGGRASHAKAPANHHGDAHPSSPPFFVFFVLPGKAGTFRFVV